MNEMKIITDHNSILELAVSSVQGDRSDQQDSYAFSLKAKEGIICVCDGMGGYEGGRLASLNAIRRVIRTYESTFPCNDPDQMLLDGTHKADEAIRELKSEEGKPLKAGSTLVSVFIRENKMYWNSVGDSRAYLIRGKEYVQITIDQNYKTVLDGQMRSGSITKDYYDREMEKGEALISYLGMKELKLIDHNAVPFQLMSGDYIVIMSDGLYKTIPEGEIVRIVRESQDLKKALYTLEELAQNRAVQYNIIRDNTTSVIVKIK